VPANRQPPSRLRPRGPQSAVDAAAVRRLAARRARSAARPGKGLDEPARDAAQQDAPQSEAPGQQASRSEPLPSAAVPLEGLGPGRQGGEQEAEEGTLADDAGHGDAPRRARPHARLIVAMALAVTTLVLGGLAAWFGTEAASLNGAPSAQNQALANPSETAQVTSQVTTAINALFSYNYANPGVTTKAASRLLTGAAVGQYSALFAEVEKKAPGEKLVVTTAVSHAGVELLTPDTARVLVFATESDGTAGASTPSTAGAMLAVNVVLHGGTWKITGIDTFSG
jgi:Mce-associated membrane protein